MKFRTSVCESMKAIKSSLMTYGSKSQRAYIQPGYQQNLSGSDTDVSTSTENLTAEEKCVLRNGIRQEPQGEETVVDDFDIASINALIHNSRLSGVSTGRSLSNDASTKPDQQAMCKTDSFQTQYPIHPDNIQYSSQKGSVPSSPKSLQRKNMFQNLQKSPCHASLQQFPSPEVYHPVSHILTSNSNSYYQLLQNSALQSSPNHELSDVPKQYLDQSEILKHLAREAGYQRELSEPCLMNPSQDSNFKWQTPEYAGIDSRLRLDGISVYNNSPPKVPARFPVSRSHPNLSKIGRNSHGSDENCAKLSLFTQRPETNGRAAVLVDSETQANQMIDLLSAENVALKNELELYYKKVSKLQKFELEILKVHQSHEDLVRSTEKREKLEQTVRMKLELEIRHLQDQNKELKDRLSSASCHMAKRMPSETSDSDFRKELSKREVLIAQLLTQNKELLAEKEQQEILLQAQRATLQEQRNHIDILDNALTNAQTNVVKLEEENRKKQMSVERVTQLQNALGSLQQSGERRLHMEKKVRLQLEREIEAMRLQKGGKANSPLPRDGNGNNESLKKIVLEYEKKIIGLEAEVSKWEQRYIEESTMRQIAVDAASVPKDAKIAALERTSQESEKLIAQARSEKLKHMDELYAANRKCAEFEGRIKDYESKLAERDAMIKVLQQHSQSKDAVFQNTVLGRPPRHTRAASTVGLTTNTSHTSCFGRASSSPSNILHRRAGSKIEMGASGSLLSISSDSPSESSPVADSVTGSQKSLDEQLKELDSRLSSKDSIISALRAEKERYPSHFWRV